MNVKDLAAVRIGAEIGELLPLLRLEIDQMTHAVENRALMALRKGELTPDLSQQLWIELLSYRELVSKLEKRVQVGVAMASKGLK